jgi:hypothetical protein
MGWWHSKNFYKSGEEPVYKLGQVVYKMWRYYNETCLSMMQFSCEHEILEVSKKKSGLLFREFTYKVKNLLNGDIIEGVYESELATEYQGIVYETHDLYIPSQDEERPKYEEPKLTKLEQRIQELGYTYDEVRSAPWPNGRPIRYKHYCNSHSEYIDLSEDGTTIISTSLTEAQRKKYLNIKGD